MYLYDLPDLNNLLDELTVLEPASIFTEETIIDFIETAFELFNEYVTENPTAISEPDFEETLITNVKEFCIIKFENNIIENDSVEDDIDCLLEYALELFLIAFIPQRSVKEGADLTCQHDIKEEIENSFIENQINTLRSVPQPVQRTNEWYAFRNNLITASNAYKAFESQAAQNQLIYEKCQPIKQATDEDNNKMVNVNTPLHWGQKYEPLSVMLYEAMYNTEVEEFGCMPHPLYKFIGASPDGINIKQGSDRYGRMLEIKNVVSRVITGIPKKEYWIQMQLQMEVCNLDKCDFLETKFIEFPDETAFYADTVSEQKGLMLHFNTKENKPFYVYKPLHIIAKSDIDEWFDEQHNAHEKRGLIWIKSIYWKLDKLSCVLVLRNKQWFNENVKQLEHIWNIILEERVTGCAHRAPNKKPKLKPFICNNNDDKGCLLKINTEPYLKTINVLKEKEKEKDQYVGCLLKSSMMPYYL
jgi:putative phage-type endonuclease